MYKELRRIGKSLINPDFKISIVRFVYAGKSHINTTKGNKPVAHTFPGVFCIKCTVASVMVKKKGHISLQNFLYSFGSVEEQFIT
ncbi:MAG: hypothetical protein E6590_05745 [Clostridiales bacterium]|nr:hypothetical protein [Clostridiales bacterium]